MIGSGEEYKAVPTAVDDQMKTALALLGKAFPTNSASLQGHRIRKDSTAHMDPSNSRMLSFTAPP